MMPLLLQESELSMFHNLIGITRGQAPRVVVNVGYANPWFGGYEMNAKIVSQPCQKSVCLGRTQAMAIHACDQFRAGAFANFKSVVLPDFNTTFHETAG